MVATIEVNYGSTDHVFRTSLTLDEFNEIKTRFRKERGKVGEISKPNWWYKKSDFGIFFLNSIKTNSNFLLKIKTKEEWRKFFPVFQYFFPTIAEYGAVKNNIAFWNAHTTSLVEDSYFVKWTLLERYGNLTFESLKDIPFKEVMMLYYYTILGKIFSNAEKYARKGIMPPPLEEEEDPDMFG